MEDHQVIIPLMGESNCSDPITRYSNHKVIIIIFFQFVFRMYLMNVYFVYSDCEKDIKEVIVIEESPSRYSFNPFNLPSHNSTILLCF